MLDFIKNNFPGLAVAVPLIFSLTGMIILNQFLSSYGLIDFAVFKSQSLLIGGLFFLITALTILIYTIFLNMDRIEFNSRRYIFLLTIVKISVLANMAIMINPNYLNDVNILGLTISKEQMYMLTSGVLTFIACSIILYETSARKLPDKIERKLFDKQLPAKVLTTAHLKHIKKCYILSKAKGVYVLKSGISLKDKQVLYEAFYYTRLFPLRKMDVISKIILAPSMASTLFIAALLFLSNGVYRGFCYYFGIVGLLFFVIMMSLRRSTWRILYREDLGIPISDFGDIPTRRTNIFQILMLSFWLIFFLFNTITIYAKNLYPYIPQIIGGAALEKCRYVLKSGPTREGNLIYSTSTSYFILIDKRVHIIPIEELDRVECIR